MLEGLVLATLSALVITVEVELELKLHRSRSVSKPLAILTSLLSPAHSVIKSKLDLSLDTGQLADAGISPSTENRMHFASGCWETSLLHSSGCSLPCFPHYQMGHTQPALQ